MDNFSIVKNKLNQFINKYYKSLLIKGIVYSVSILTIYIVTFSFIEYLGWLSSQVRFIIFWFTIVSLLFVFNFFILIPLLRLLGIASKITERHAALFIQNNIESIDDELINTLELSELSVENESDLIRASLNQKSESLILKDFNTAVNLYSKKYIYAIALLFVFIISFLVKPDVYTEGTKRILKYNVDFDKYENVKISFYDSLNCKRNSDYLLKVKITGNVDVNNLFLKIGNSDFLMESLSDSVFQFTLKNINNNFDFYFYSDDFISKSFHFNIIDSPIVKYLHAKLVYPAYINRKSDNLKDIYEFSVPQGTEIQWTIKSIYTDSLFIEIDSSRSNFTKNRNIFTFDSVFTKSFVYSVKTQNSIFKNAFIDQKMIEVIPDVYPSIKITKIIDEDNFSISHFKIHISDDYGFYNLKFYGSNDTIIIPVNRNINNQEAFFTYDFSSYNDTLYEYYFAVRDNDPLHGYKETRSQLIKFNKPGLNKLVKDDLNKTNKISESITKAIEKSNELQSEIEKLKKDLLNQNLAEWERKERLDQLKEKQNDINKLLNELNQLNNEKNTFNKSFSNVDENILEKQQKLQDAMENLMTDEIKKLFEELEELKNELSNAEINDLVNKIDLNFENLESELDKNLELINRLKIEQNIDNIASQLEELSKSQEQLSEDIDNNKLTDEEISDKIKSDKESFEELQENFDQLLDENQKLSTPFYIDDFDNEMGDIDSNFEKQSGDQNNGDKSDNAKQNSDKLKELADKMKSQMQSSSAEQEGENADNLRLLLENLFYISFEQESLLNQSKSVSPRDPKYLELQSDQIKLENDFSIVRDSLNELSKRTAHLGNHISELTFNIEKGLTECNGFFTERRNSSLYRSQQEVLMNINELLLLLSESLKSMENKASGSGGGKPQPQSKRKQKPKKRGDGEPSLGDLKQGQESLKSQLEQMLQQMKDGSSPGLKGNKQLAKMLAQQEIYQQMLNQLMNNGSVGSKVQEQLKEIQRLMEQNKRDIVNMNINNSTLYRQQMITTRLLEAENAEMERETDNKRESKEVLNYNLSEAHKYFEEYDEKIKFKEIFMQEYLELKDYYKELYNTYILNVNSDHNE